MSTEVILLGTGTPNAEPDRAGSSLAIVVDGQPYLVDFGPGIVRRAQAAVAAGHEAMAMPNLSRAFLTHLHADHCAGYADLIITPWVLERTDPLTVYGPPGLQSMTTHVLAAYEADIRQRLDGLEPANRTGYAVQAHEFEPGLVYADDRVQVEAIPVRHGSWAAFAYKFTTAERVIVVSGDTAPCPALIEAARGCDVLIHEVYSGKGFVRRPVAWQAYHAAVHTSAAQLGQIAAEVEPGLLVLYHQLFWGVSEEDLMVEVRAGGYVGELQSGYDLLVL